MLQRTSIRASLLSGSCAAAVLCLGASTAKATITFNFDENGNGTVTGPAGNTTPLTSLGNQVDPVDPGNGLLPLVYRMPSIGGVLPVPGDVDVLEPATPAGLHSDLLRWANSSVGPLLIVYSDKPEPGEIAPLADVGIPVFRQPNQLTQFETGPEAGPNGLFGYTPTPNQPGAINFAAAGPTVYNFTSDKVPEPSHLAVLGLASLMLLRRRRRTVSQTN